MRVTAVIALTTLADIDLQISNNGPLFQMTRTERVLCEFPTKDVGPKNESSSRRWQRCVNPAGSARAHAFCRGASSNVGLGDQNN